LQALPVQGYNPFMPTALNYHIRPASQEDEKRIKDLIQRVQINPMGIHWERFVVAETTDNMFIGCGQIKQHFDGSQELASIAVEEEYRGHGIAAAIINRLLENPERPLYLMCRPRLGTFYEKFGFSALQVSEYPRYFLRMHRMVRMMPFLTKGHDPLIMRLEQ
jgi:N-acetylglutamate synthase-like GNAT family acetyltransferase